MPGPRRRKDAMSKRAAPHLAVISFTSVLSPDVARALNPDRAISECVHTAWPSMERINFVQVPGIGVCPGCVREPGMCMVAWTSEAIRPWARRSELKILAARHVQGDSGDSSRFFPEKSDSERY
jgi:hypothetical protein